MNNKCYKLTTAILAMVLFFTAFFPERAWAQNIPKPELEARAAILLDHNTGKILYAKNEHQRMYPASVTKILTAMVALDYLDPNEVLITGQEVFSIPPGSSKAGHLPDEAITVENLLRGLIIRSGNETACVLALETVRRKTENPTLDYNSAEKIFAGLMNEKAKLLGAENSKFINPHGYHHPSHYSTAYDMALIANAAMENEVIRRIAGETEFVGNGAGENPNPAWKTKEYNWKTHNLILLEGEEFYNPQATGIKTGFTNEAGHCLAASAEKDDRQLISVVMFSEDPNRWLDTNKLFDYGFNNFQVHSVQEANQVIETVPIHNPRLGEADRLTILTNSSFGDLYRREDFDRIQWGVVYYDQFIAPYTDEERQAEGFTDIIRLKAPIAANETVGKITYYLDGQIIFSDEVRADIDVLERTFNSDVDYYVAKTKSVVFSKTAIPFWVCGILLIILLLVLLIRRRRIRNRSMFYTPRKFNKRNRW